MGILRKDKKSTESPSSSSSSTSPCYNLRAAYHNCFNSWYTEKFVKGQWDKEECVSEWEKYKACLSEHLKDKHFSRLLEAEGSTVQTEPSSSSASSASDGVPQ